MKKFLLKISLFAAILFSIDRIAGYAFAYLSKNSKGGYTGHYHHLTEKTNDDVLIFGSSRAIHHYNPQIITDSLGLSCYNCGQDGNGIILLYGWWKMISKRYHPKMVIYDITDDFDLLKGEDNHRYLGWLKEAYDRDGIKDIFLSVDETERYKMMSLMYRYNSNWPHIVLDYVWTQDNIKDNGFSPLEGSLDPMKVRKNVNLDKSFELDELKLEFLNRFVREIGDTKLIFVVSPLFYGHNEAHLKPIRELCEKYNIKLYDYSNSEKYVHNADFFKDGAHLNAKGADEFTKEFVSILDVR